MHSVPVLIERTVSERNVPTTNPARSAVNDGFGHVIDLPAVRPVRALWPRKYIHAISVYKSSLGLAHFGATFSRYFGATVALKVIMEDGKDNFEIWKVRLREDCERLGKSQAFQCLGEYSLKLLWKAKTEPSVQGDVDGAQESRAA